MMMMMTTTMKLGRAVLRRNHGRNIKASGSYLCENARIQRSFGAVTTVDVPGMGDSITEGLVSEWVINVGDVVNVDDVLVIIETDKVAVDVRSEHSGKITALHCAEGEDVEVGAKLFDIEVGEGRPTTTSEVPVANEEESSREVAVEVAPAAEPQQSPHAYKDRFEAMRHNHHRTPLIKFTHGKRDAEVTSPTSKIDASSPVVVGGSAGELFPQGPIVVGSPLYGRPLLSEEEIEAINTGVYLVG